MTAAGPRPALEYRPAPGGTRALAVFCHGGTVASVEPPKDRALSLLRMRAIEQFVHAAAADRGVGTGLLRYRVAGWNGAAADAHADVRWVLEELRARHGADVPVVLVGHSMGGRAVLRAADDASVRAVCALAPWTPPGEPVGHLRGQTVAVLHGRGDRWVPAALSADYADRAQQAGARIARFTIAGGHGMVRRAPVWHAFVRDVVLAGAGLAPWRADLRRALAESALAVPL
ncbi:Alpha/beta hydrolase family protein [Geodermatophilus pulveris]|uniref:Alpha/beta hydrolase family protein n=1 Tax=Geodermatophilus pulveris TaxID=1564159 RepID=A0A239FGF1_9ACTN|nr:alpha/beta fold hydrolase [Geodermatophilus pulveris]SNS56006.1 Alpha/beta hydrolase family protein [Geodermatophilus pulveris]